MGTPKLQRYSFKPIGRLIYTFLTDANYTDKVCNILIGIEIIFNLLIISFINYTEIDWKAYMQEVSGAINDTLDYSLLRGDTGPLVYPGLFVYIFSILYYITNFGKNIRFAQFIYMMFYILQLKLISKIHKIINLSPGCLILLCLSKRIHSIFVLRLFNDPIAMLVAYFAIFYCLKKQYINSTILFSLAVGVKMNVLLFIPGYLFILFTNNSLIELITHIALFLIVQVILGLPFLLINYKGYLNAAFEFNRQFDFTWTVNWRMIPQPIFNSILFSKTLLIIHLILLLLFLFTCWISPFGNIISYLKLKLTNINKIRRDFILPKDMLMILYISNFIGILCSRSLHYQFYSWYYHSLPILFYIIKKVYPIWYLIFLFISIEYCWNVYPSTNLSSTLLLAAHLSILFAIWFSYQLYPMKLNNPNTLNKKED